jgi:hypothetical protein
VVAIAVFALLIGGAVIDRDQQLLRMAFGSATEIRAVR